MQIKVVENLCVAVVVAAIVQIKEALKISECCSSCSNSANKRVVENLSVAAVIVQIRVVENLSVLQ